MPDRFPRLTTDLTGPKHPEYCQCCGAYSESDTLVMTRWQEHDDADRAEPGRYVVLCKGCSDRIIKPHARLYHELQVHEPVPGTMAICAACAFRDELRCTHPHLKANGGVGLILRFPPPIRGFVDYGGKKKHLSGRMILYSGAVECSERKPT